MSRLLRLYPAAWRERYEAEFIGTLQERSVGLAGSMDIVRGAIDAHLHPELIGGAPHIWTHRLPGLMATVAGLIWSWYYLRIALAAPQEWGYGVLLAMFLMFIAVLGEYIAPYTRQIGRTAIVLIAAALLAGVQPLNVIGDGMLNFAFAAAAMLLLSGGLLTLAALRAGLGTGARWVLIIGGLLVPLVIAIPVMGGFGPTDPGGVPAMMVALLPYGIAWAIIGLRMTIRGSETIHDAPATGPVSEAAPA